MKKRSHAIEKGVGFGITSGVITTLGMMVGLDAGTHSSLAVIVGVFAVAVSDSFSDAMGIHTAEEVDIKATKKSLWELTFSTFFSKLVFTLSFVLPVLFFDLATAIVASIFWGLFLIGSFSCYVAIVQKKRPGPIIAMHIGVTLLVIAITYYVGKAAGYLGGLL